MKDEITMFRIVIADIKLPFQFAEVISFLSLRCPLPNLIATMMLGEKMLSLAWQIITSVLTLWKKNSPGMVRDYLFVHAKCIYHGVLPSGSKMSKMKLKVCD